MELVLGILALWSVALSVGDLRTRRLPNVVTLPALGGAMVGVAMYPAATPGLFMTAGVYGVAFWFGGCGGGDLKLAATLGALAGSMTAAAVLVVLAQVVALVVAIIRRDLGAQPHAPPLCVAAAVCFALW